MANMCFLFRIEENCFSMCHYNEIEHGCKNCIFNCEGTEPPFRATLLFGYAQSGYERTSFLGSTVYVEMIALMFLRHLVDLGCHCSVGATADTSGRGPFIRPREGGSPRSMFALKEGSVPKKLNNLVSEF